MTLTFETDGEAHEETVIFDRDVTYMPQSAVQRKLLAATMVSMAAARNRSKAVEMTPQA